jgi:Mrp family chromosome partitioning ATPase
MSDATLLVVHSGTTRTHTLKRAKEYLAQSGTRLAGLVLNCVTAQTDGYYYSYYYNGDGAGGPPAPHQGTPRRRLRLPFAPRATANRAVESVPASSAADKQGIST